MIYGMDAGPFDDPLFSEFGPRAGGAGGAANVHSIQVMLGLHGNHHGAAAPGELIPPGSNHLHKLGNYCSV